MPASKNILKIPPQSLMIDIGNSQDNLTKADKQRICHPLVGGVILFKRNINCAEQLRKLCQQIRQIAQTVNKQICIAIDEEGGIVSRLRDVPEFYSLPPMEHIGRLWQTDPFMAQMTAYAAGALIGTQIRSLGIDHSFTPVLDQALGSPVISSRAFAQEPEIITACSYQLSAALHATGLASTAKHFPGHGATSQDSHHELAIDKRTWDNGLAQSCEVFQTYLHKSKAAQFKIAIMSAHVLYPDICDQIATYSKKWLRQILRRQLGFIGPIISDDLCMQAAANGGIIARLNRAYSAGCDLFLVCDCASCPELFDKLTIIKPSATVTVAKSTRSSYQCSWLCANIFPQLSLGDHEIEALRNKIAKIK